MGRPTKQSISTRRMLTILLGALDKQGLAGVDTEKLLDTAVMLVTKGAEDTGEQSLFEEIMKELSDRPVDEVDSSRLLALAAQIISKNGGMAKESELSRSDLMAEKLGNISSNVEARDKLKRY